MVVMLIRFVIKQLQLGCYAYARVVFPCYGFIYFNHLFA